MLPLWTLRDTPIRLNEVYSLVILFVIYNIWLTVNNTNVLTLNHKTYYNIKHNIPIGPISYYVSKLKNTL